MQTTMIKNYNDVIPAEAKGLVFGGVNGIYDPILIENGIWNDYLVARENQASIYFDTWNCVAESALNKLEILFKYWYENGLLAEDDIKWLTKNGYLVNGEINFSARFIGALAGTKVKIGNSGDKIGNTISSYGLIPESSWPFDLREMDPKINNPENFYKTPPKKLLDLGQEFKKRFKIDWEYVWGSGVSEALKRSPIQVFVNAWYKNHEGLYYNPTGSINHAVVKKSPIAPQIFDSYDPFEKSLTEDYAYYPIGFKYTITKQITNTPMKLQKYQTYLLVEGNEQKYAFADLDGLLIADHGKEIFAQLNSAARLGGMAKVKVIPVSLADWNSVPHYNFKKERID